VCVFVCVCVPSRLCVCVCWCGYVCVRTYIYIYIYICVRSYTYVQSGATPSTSTDMQESSEVIPDHEPLLTALFVRKTGCIFIIYFDLESPRSVRWKKRQLTSRASKRKTTSLRPAADLPRDQVHSDASLSFGQVNVFRGQESKDLYFPKQMQFFPSPRDVPVVKERWACKGVTGVKGGSFKKSQRDFLLSVGTVKQQRRSKN
jgi:hypothetical protein